MKNAVLIRQKASAHDGMPFTPEDALSGKIRFDHRPPLEARPFDTNAGDFIPPQLDHRHIEAMRSAAHDQRTFGRKEGAERVATTRNSDQGEAAHTRLVKDKDAIHRAKLASKAGNYKAAAEILSSVKSRRRLRPKRKIANRGFPKVQRPFPSRKKQQEKRPTP